jgi:predicted SnoaL-like aldol condensation-catalyzing enzyme
MSSTKPRTMSRSTLTALHSNRYDWQSACLALLLSGCASSSSNRGSERAIPGTQAADARKQQVLDLLESIETGDSEPAGVINSTTYIQHNLGAADGLAGFGALLQQLPAGSARVNTVRIFRDGDHVFAHTPQSCKNDTQCDPAPCARGVCCDDAADSCNACDNPRPRRHKPRLARERNRHR